MGALGKRLTAVLEITPKGVAADIGTDHGYLARELVFSGKAEKAIATDKNPGPLEAARHTISAAGLSNKIELRLGDGLSALRSGEVKNIIIAGMGGTLIREILAASPKILDTTDALILCPMKDGDALRRWLYENGWHLKDELLAEERKHIYEVMLAVKGKEDIPPDNLLLVGPILAKKPSPLFTKRINLLLNKYRRIAEGISVTGEENSGKKTNILARIRDLEALLDD